MIDNRPFQMKVGEAFYRTVRGRMGQWAENMRLNLDYILEDADKYGEELDVIFLGPNVFPDRDCSEAIYCASGETLEDFGPFLRDWNGLLVCGPSNAAFCAAHGRVPDIIVSVDGHDNTASFVEDFPYWEHGTILITSQNTAPRLNDFWKGRKYWYKTYICPPGHPEEPGREYFNIIVESMFPELKSWCYMVGCTSVREVLVINNTTQFDVKRSFLAGFDFGYPRKKTRHDSFKWDGENWNPKGIDNSVDESKEHLVVNGIKTRPDLHRYYDNFNKVMLTGSFNNIYDSSDGLIDWLPRVDPEYVVNGNHDNLPELTSEDIKDMVQPYFESIKEEARKWREERTLKVDQITPADYSRQIKENIILLIEERKISRKRIADSLALDENIFKSILNDGTELTSTQLGVISQELGVGIRLLFRGLP